VAEDSDLRPVRVVPRPSSAEIEVGRVGEVEPEDDLQASASNLVPSIRMMERVPPQKSSVGSTRPPTTWAMGSIWKDSVTVFSSSVSGTAWPSISGYC
jgi:hypothetical protein